MKKILVSTFAALFIIGSLAGCSASDRRTTGTVGGAVIGGVAGSALTGGSTAGTVAGAVGGGYVGSRIAH